MVKFGDPSALTPKDWSVSLDEGQRLALARSSADIQCQQSGRKSHHHDLRRWSAPRRITWPASSPRRRGQRCASTASAPGLVGAAGPSKDKPEFLPQKEMAVLKTLTNVEDVAESFVFAAKNTSLTGEIIRVDVGLCI